ncbi:MAG: iron(III) transport system substrate-binding protein [Solirubrobacteraceae bacterium]|nr:iron(III) transport system substrate-binding protein [Solirubrobacteraceae bacterium]
MRKPLTRFHPPIRRCGRLGGLSVPASALAVAAAGLLAGCGSSSGPNGALTLYSGQHQQTTDALVKAFEKQTAIKVNVRHNDEDVFAAQISAEGSHSPADVFYTENTPALENLREKGLLGAVLPSTLAATPSRFNSAHGQWVGTSARVNTLVYNTKLLSPSQLPTSLMGLADPKWKGKLAISPGETDFQPIVTSVAVTYGKAAALKWLEAIKANAAGHDYPSNEVLTDEVNRGQAAIGVINQYYWYRHRAEVGPSSTHSAIAYFAPKDVGYVLDVSGAGVLKSSTHAAAAQKFLAFLVSKAGQEIISRSDSFEYPIGSGVTTVQPETPFSQLQPNSISLEQLGDGSAALALIQQAQLL